MNRELQREKKNTPTSKGPTSVEAALSIVDNTVNDLAETDMVILNPSTLGKSEKDKNANTLNSFRNTIGNGFKSGKAALRSIEKYPATQNQISTETNMTLQDKNSYETRRITSVSPPPGHEPT